MRIAWILFRKELMSFFLSPVAYIVAVCVLFLNGCNVSQITSILNHEPSDYSVFQIFFLGIPTWLIVFMVPPIITMRLFADEKRMGTIECLMTAPVRDWEYVMGKYLPALAFYLLLWLPTINMVFVLRHFAQDKTPLDPGPIIGGYLGILLTGMLFIAIGCMTSACTRNQIIAAVLSFAIGTGIFFAGLLFFYYSSDRYREVFQYFSLYAHVEELCRGAFVWERLVFYLTGTFFFLFMTHRIVQARQWKN
jgi:ABC-2 type transport system permease protein